MSHIRRDQDARAAQQHATLDPHAPAHAPLPASTPQANDALVAGRPAPYAGAAHHQSMHSVALVPADRPFGLGAAALTRTPARLAGPAPDPLDLSETELVRRHPDTFLGEPMIFRAARVLLEYYAEEGTAALADYPEARRTTGYRDHWIALSQEPVAHLLTFPSELESRFGHWRAGRRSWAFHLNPGPMSRELLDIRNIPHALPGPFDARDIEGFKILFDYIAPSDLMPWHHDFERRSVVAGATPQALDDVSVAPSAAVQALRDQATGPAALRTLLGHDFSDAICVAPAQGAGLPIWARLVDSRAVQVQRVDANVTVTREGFETWRRPSPGLVAALPMVLQRLLVEEPVPLTDSVRRLVALCALMNMPAQGFGIATGDALEGYEGFELMPVGDFANMLEFVSFGAPSIDAYFAIIIDSGVFLELHGEGMPKLGRTLSVMIEELHFGLEKVVRLCIMQQDPDALTRILGRLDGWCFTGQMRVLEEILVELGESVLAPDAVLLRRFHPADSDQDKAAALVGALRQAQLRRFADATGASVTNGYLAEQAAFQTDYFSPKVVRDYLQQQEDLADRSAGGLDRLMAFLADDLVIFG